MIEIKNLKKIWEDDGSSVLENINLKIEDGDIYALVGRSGAGKSTLLRCINGLTSYQEGSLTVDGCEVKPWRKGTPGIPASCRYDFPTVFVVGKTDSISECCSPDAMLEI